MWKKALLWVLVSLVELMVILVVGELLYLKYKIQYYNGERLDEVALNAKAEEYLKLLDEMKSRPLDDRLAFEDMLSRMEPYLDNDVLRNNECEDIMDKQIKPQIDMIDEVIKFDDTYRSIVSDGFNLQYDSFEQLFTFDFLEYRNLLYMQMRAVLLEKMRSQPEAAADRILLNIQMINGLYNTPDTLPIIMAVHFEGILYYTLVNVLPYLSSNDVPRIMQALRSIPSAKRTLAESFRPSCATWIPMFDKSPDIEKEISYAHGWGILPGWMDAFVWRILDYSRWEKMRYIKAYSDLYENYKRWIELGAQGNPSGGLDVKKKLYDDPILAAISPVAQLSWSGYDSIMTRASSIDRRRAAILAACDAELRRRSENIHQTVTLPYEDDEQIVLSYRRGCIHSTRRSDCNH